MVLLTFSLGNDGGAEKALLQRPLSVTGKPNRCGGQGLMLSAELAAGTERTIGMMNVKGELVFKVGNNESEMYVQNNECEG